MDCHSRCRPPVQETLNFPDGVSILGENKMSKEVF